MTLTESFKGIANFVVGILFILSVAYMEPTYFATCLTGLVLLNFGFLKNLVTGKKPHIMCF
ncbi:MAG: hypothetical protein GY765_21155 [bacterium]|nr:hypothetical protein [bacterium]